MSPDNTDDLELTEEALQGDFYYLPSTSQVHDLIARPEEEIEAVHEGSESPNSDDDTEADEAEDGTNLETLSSANKVSAVNKEQPVSPTPKKGATKKSKNSELAEVSTGSNLRRGRSRKVSASVSPKKTLTVVARRKYKESEKNNREESNREGSIQCQTRQPSPEITPTKTKDVNQEKPKRGRPRKETSAASPERNRSPDDTPRKKQKTSNARENKSSKVLDGCDHTARGRRTNLKVRGGRTGARTRGSKKK